MVSKRVVLLIAVMALATVAGVAARSQFRERRHSQPAFTLISRVTHINPDNPGQQLQGEEVRHAFSDGSYHVISKGGAGATQEYFFKHGAGFFEVDTKQKRLVRNPRMSPDAGGHRPPTAEELRSDPQFIRTEEVSGLTAYVMRIADEQTGQPLTDLYFAVETGRTPIKTVDYGRDGAPVTAVEPVRLIFGEPSRSMLNVPDYPTVEGDLK